MLSRSLLAIGAATLAAVAAVVSQLDGDTDLVPFFVGLALAGGGGAWATHEPFTGRRKLLARFIGGSWLIAAAWIGALLVMYKISCGCSMPVRPPDETYVGLTATVYHLAAVYLGGALMTGAAFSRALGR